MRRLLALEKERRGVAPDQLVFIGVHNLAQYYWCAMQAVLKSRANEEQFFSVYLQDRVRYAFALGIIDDLPDSDEALLRVGEEISLKDVESLPRPERRVCDTETSLEDKLDAFAFFEQKGYMKSPFSFGDSAEALLARDYPTLRWNFSWPPYAIIGVPDGLTEDLVYEFKAARKEFLGKHFEWPILQTQADLYGYFFGRKKKKIALFVHEAQT